MVPTLAHRTRQNGAALFGISCRRKSSSSGECLAAAVHWEGTAGSFDCALLRFAHSAPLRMTELGGATFPPIFITYRREPVHSSSVSCHVSWSSTGRRYRGEARVLPSLAKRKKGSRIQQPRRRVASFWVGQSSKLSGTHSREKHERSYYFFRTYCLRTQ
jgi:hypothetical protein